MIHREETRVFSFSLSLSLCQFRAVKATTLSIIRFIKWHEIGFNYVRGGRVLMDAPATRKPWRNTLNRGKFHPLAKNGRERGKRLLWSKVMALRIEF